MHHFFFFWLLCRSGLSLLLSLFCCNCYLCIPLHLWIPIPCKHCIYEFPFLICFVPHFLYALRIWITIPCMLEPCYSSWLVFGFCGTLQLRPNFADAWSNLASAYMRKGRLNEAAQCCRQALALNPLLVCFYPVMLFLCLFVDLVVQMRTKSSFLVLWILFFSLCFSTILATMNFSNYLFYQLAFRLILTAIWGI